MSLKQKYIIGFTALSLITSLPLTSAADDDDVVVFGDQFDEKSEQKIEPVAEPQPQSQTEVKTEPEVKSEPEIKSEPEVNSDIEIKTEQSEVKSEPEVKAEPEVIQNSQPDEKIENIDQSPIDNPLQTNDEFKSEPQTEQPIINETQTVNQPVEEIKPEIETQPVDVVIDTNYELGEIYPEEKNNFDDTQPTDVEISIGEPTVEVKPNPISETKSEPVIQQPVIQQPTNQNDNSTSKSTPNYSERHNPKSNANQQQKILKARFVKLFSDDNFDYYLDRQSVQWIKMPYSTSEYMADVWIRMIERNTSPAEDHLYKYISASDDEISEAANKGIIYDPVDVKVLRTKKYILEHYYLRPKTKQVQFLCDLEVIGRPQNAVSERAYEYKNWENLIPGSVEFAIYYGVIDDIGTKKASEKGHMKVKDQIEEYVRISIR